MPHYPTNPPKGVTPATPPPPPPKKNGEISIELTVRSGDPLQRAITAERKLREAVNAIRYLRQYAKETFEHWDGDRDAKVANRLQAMAGGLKGYNASLDAIMSQFCNPDPNRSK